MRAVGATIERVIGLDAVPDDLTATVVAYGRELVNRTLEAVERMMRACRDDFKGQVIIVAADFTLGHLNTPLSYSETMPSTNSGSMAKRKRTSVFVSSAASISSASSAPLSACSSLTCAAPVTVCVT